jgi:hypothetical protein
MALIDLYRRYMYGQSPSGTSDVMMNEGTRGLLGTGGQMGGGLLNTFEQPDTQGLYDIATNPLVGIGASLFQRGQMGQTPGMAAGGSILEGLKFSETASKLEDAQKKRKLIEQYADQIPEKDKNAFLIDPAGYLKRKQTQTTTAAQKNFAAYKKIMETGTEEEKKLAKDIFVKGGRELKSEQEFLLGVANTLSKDVTLNADDIQKKLPEYSKIYNKIVGDVDSNVIQEDQLSPPKKFKGSVEQWNQLKKSNPDFPDKQLVDYFNKKYGG